VQDFEPGGLRRLYAPSSIVCLPLQPGIAAQGITTLLEAMAMGKAAISTRTAGLANYIVEGETGLTVAPGDVEAWKAAIGRLCRDHSLRERLGQNARRWVEQNATLETWIGTVIVALQSAISRRGAALSSTDRSYSSKLCRLFGRGSQ
jgi:glycosyltransferase involved in cell wall biosynthesis